jgi:cephalosporin hydroxylase
MKLIIDTEGRVLSYEANGQTHTIGLYTSESFEYISKQWLKVGWDQKYAYTFSWLGRPIIQLPEDMIRAQEVIYQLQPDVIVETGVAHGGSLIYYASLCQLIGRGRVIGVDIEIRPHNRNAIEAHPLSHLITLIEADSVAPETVQQVRSLVRSDETVLVFLDSCHTKAHVRAELEAYSDLVSPGSYIVATDGIMADLADVPRGDQSWCNDNPMAAAIEFATEHPEFKSIQPSWSFNESQLDKNVTHWPSAWLQRKIQDTLNGISLPSAYDLT